MSHDRARDEAPCRWRDTAWLFVLGNLTDDEDVSYREHLLEGCGACGTEIEYAREVVADLDVAVAERGKKDGVPAPDPFLERLRERVAGLGDARASTPFSDHVEQRSSTHAVASTLPGVVLVPESEEGWRETSVDGVRFKTLVEDVERRYATALVRMRPGASYPSHRHAGREECYVIAGDLRMGEHRLEQGDYQVAEAGSLHPVQTTENGCLLLIVSSQDDVPLGQ